MTSVIIDASVIVACAIADGKARRTLLSGAEVEFYAPEFTLEESRKRVPKILALSAVSPEVLSVLFDELFSKIAVVSREGYHQKLEEAAGLARRAGAQGDEDYIALALTLNAPIWTYDNDFHRIRAVRVISREQVELGQVD